MGELNDYCQCCYVRLPHAYLSYRCRECFLNDDCDKGCGKCVAHCTGRHTVVEEVE